MKPLAGKILGANPPSAFACSLRERTRRVAEIAADQAPIVDREGYFPLAAISAAKEAKLLALLVPSTFGGEGASVAKITDVYVVESMRIYGHDLRDA